MFIDISVSAGGSPASLYLENYFSSYTVVNNRFVSQSVPWLSVMLAVRAAPIFSLSPLDWMSLAASYQNNP